MTFKDILKNSFLEGFRTDIPSSKLFVTLIFAVLMGLYIYTVYRYKSKSYFYSKDFNNTLAVLPVITAGIVLAMQASVVISLGMVGALSIVRFRNAVKNSLDLVFLFWSISMGIITGAGIYEIALFVSFVTTVILLVLDFVPGTTPGKILFVHGTDIDFSADLEKTIKEHTKWHKLKSVNKNKNGVDFVIELKSKDENKLIAAISSVEKVQSFNLLTHDGEVRF